MLDSRNEFSSLHLTMNLKNLELRHLLMEKSKYESGDSEDEPGLETDLGSADVPKSLHSVIPNVILSLRFKV